ncbi:hypothetical protein EB796_001552 [Bugula neritina]|uniref:Uncharacterized protein n=1 Tax=Bugula neritina TaxID=10212 RepID=A0A7J7KPN0_BUGNE|nr:hypothetical protein EB796_001552 [Bugula neritina]
MSKKFLFDKKEAEEEREFHSKGYHPMEKKLLVDLDSVWSVKDVVLDCSNKSMPTDRVNAGTSYYSRHGKTQTGKVDTNKSVGAENSQWNRKEFHNPQQKNLSSRTPDDPLDF